MKIKIEKEDLSKCEGLIKIFADQKKEAETKVDEACYDLWANYFKTLIRAKSEGKLIVGHNWFTPIDIFRALDMVPLCINGYAQIMNITLNLVDEVFEAGTAAGLAPELCGSHIYSPGLALKGWMIRPDVVVWNHSPCDNTAKQGRWCYVLACQRMPSISRCLEGSSGCNKEGGRHSGSNDDRFRFQ